MQPGFFWHVHDEQLLGWCFNYDERAKYISTDKPYYEQELRLRLLQPVKGQLPQEVVDAGEAYSEARNAYGEAWKAYDEALKAYNKAFSNHKDEIEKLHSQECPNCPWNGETIFSAA